MQKLFTSPKLYVLALPWEIWGDILSRQRSTYMYILMNQWVATNTSGSCCLKNHHTYSKLYHLYITYLKCQPPTHIKISDVDASRRTSEQSESRCSLNVRLATASRVCRYSQWFIEMYMYRKYCVDSSICHFKFPKVGLVLAYCIYFRWGGQFLHSFVKCFFRDKPAVFIEIGLYLIDTE